MREFGMSLGQDAIHERSNPPELHSALSDVDVVSFDVWLTLIRSNPSFKPARAELLGQHLGYTGDEEDLGKIIREVDVESDKLTDLTGVQYGFEDRVRGIYDKLPTRLPQLTPHTMEALETDMSNLMRQYPPLLLEDDLSDTFKTLKSHGFRLAVVSNTGFIDGKYMRQAFADNGIGEHLDYMVFSNEAGVAKPDPTIFNTLADQAGVQSGRILHIGDNPKADYAGGQNAGFKVLQLTESSEEGRQTIPTIRTLIGK